MDTNLIILFALIVGALFVLLLVSRTLQAKSLERAVALAKKAGLTASQTLFVADGGRKATDISQVQQQNRRKHERGWLIRMRDGQIQTAEIGEGMDPDEILKDPERFTPFTEA
jgi:hypothetical protein